MADRNKYDIAPGRIYGGYKVLEKASAGWSLECLFCGSLNTLSASKFIKNIFGCTRCNWDKQVNTRIKANKIYGGLKAIHQVNPTEQYRETWSVQCLSCDEIFNLVDYSIKRNKIGCSTCAKKTSRAAGNGVITGRMFGRFQYNAQRRNIEFSLTLADVIEVYEIQIGKCFYSGYDLTKQNVSIDRTDSSKGYHKNNITLVIKDINFMKYNFTEKNFLELVDAISQWQKI